MRLRVRRVERSPALAKYLIKVAQPLLLKDAPGGSGYLKATPDQLNRGKLVFAHPSNSSPGQWPPHASFGQLGPIQFALDARSSPCAAFLQPAVAPEYPAPGRGLEDWERPGGRRDLPQKRFEPFLVRHTRRAMDS